jgi:hypothetical protein
MQKTLSIDFQSISTKLTQKLCCVAFTTQFSYASRSLNRFIPDLQVTRFLPDCVISVVFSGLRIKKFQVVIYTTSYSMK